MVLVEEESLHCAGYLLEDGEETVDLGAVVDVLAEQLGLSPFVDHVPLDGAGFAQVVFAVDQVGQVGEVQSEVQLVLLEPFVSLSVCKVLKLYS